MITSRHFSEIEFNRCTPSCSLQDMNQAFMHKLDRLRDKAGIPLTLNSAYRSIAWEKSKGRSGSGDHPQGKGADIRCYASNTRYKIVKAAFEIGFRRIGIAKNFVHVGDGNNLPNDVIWLY